MVFFENFGFPARARTCEEAHESTVTQSQWKRPRPLRPKPCARQNTQSLPALHGEESPTYPKGITKVCGWARESARAEESVVNSKRNRHGMKARDGIRSICGGRDETEREPEAAAVNMLPDEEERARL